jgi:hypothetical protein
MRQNLQTYWKQMYMTVQYLVNIDRSAGVLEENEICIVYPQFIILHLTVFEIICNTREINSQHCYTMLTCLNLAFSSQQSSEHAWRLSSLKSNILSLQSFLPLECICLHFFISVTMLGDFCMLLCACCKEHPLFLVLFCSWLSIHLRPFTVKW